MVAPNFDLAHVLSQYTELQDLVKEPATGRDHVINVFERWERLRRRVSAWKARAQLQLRRDVFDESAAADGRAVAEAAPLFEALDGEVKAYFVASNERQAVEQIAGAATLARWESDLTAFAPAIQDDLRAETELTNEYFQLIGKVRASVRGEAYSLTGLGSFAEDADRSLRREASEAGWTAVGEQTADLDTIFDALVHRRAAMARKLGYTSYITLAYKRRGRVDYGPADVARFRDEIVESIVPLAASLAREQEAALGVELLMPWDEGLFDALPPPRPPAMADMLMRRLKSVADSIDPTFDEFITLMMQTRFMDLSDRPGKAGGGFCTFLPDEGMPFVFANYTGACRDVRSIIHELGHAFQKYRSRDHRVLEHIVPTSEIGEIHSIALELLAERFYDELFRSDARRYRLNHLKSLVTTLPYIAAIDHFQEVVYAEPSATFDDRCEMWLQMERRYLPWKDFGGIELLARGRRWQRQRHVYAFPFYYIDYGLAICCALQLWFESLRNRAEALQKYLSLCSLGGTLAFQALLDRVSIRSRFQAGTLADVVRQVSWS